MPCCFTMHEARLAAIMGSCPRTHKSFRSGRSPNSRQCAVHYGLTLCEGLRNWIEFVEAAYGDDKHAFPPPLEGVIAWSLSFRCAGTFCNYLGFLRGACYALGVDAPAVGHPALRRAIGAIVKRQLFTERCCSLRRPGSLHPASCLQRPKLFIERCTLRNMLARAQQTSEGRTHAALWLVSYLFLLRVPSEAGTVSHVGAQCSYITPLA